MSKGIDMLMRGMGVDPSFMQQAAAFVEHMKNVFTNMHATQGKINTHMEDTHAAISTMLEQLNRMETTMQTIWEGMGSVEAAAPTNYTVPTLDKLPPFEGNVQ